MHNINPKLAHLAQPVAELRHYPGNARTHDLQLIAGSLKANTQYRTIAVRRHDDPERHNVVLAGNGTLEAARDVLGWTELAVEYVECTDAEARRIVLIDNSANDAAGYDDAALAALLAELRGDYEGTGFNADDLDRLLAELEAPAQLNDPDSVPTPSKRPAVTQLGDVWQAGPHRILCGDATDAAGVFLMLDGDQPDVVWTDPPYGVSYVGGTKESLTIQNDGKKEHPALIAGAMATIAAVCRPGAPVYVAHADVHRVILENAMTEAGMTVRQNLVWVKSSLVMGRADYHYRHEPILAAHTADDAELVVAVDPALSEAADADHGPILYGFTPGGEGRLGRGGPRWHGDNKSSTVFEVPKPSSADVHPTMKPVALITAMLKNSLRPGGLVLDLFGGSGSTMIAAHVMRSRSALVELDPHYVDVELERFQRHTGIVPVNTRTGQPHDFTLLG